MASLLTLENIHKTFEVGTVNENHVLKGLDLEVEEGDFYLCDWWKWSREIHFDEYLGWQSIGGRREPSTGREIH